MNSFGASETLILAGTVLLVSGRVTEGWIIFGLGVASSFFRYTTWYGNNVIEKED